MIDPENLLTIELLVKYSFLYRQNLLHFKFELAIHHLLIIGEACSQVSDSLKNEYPDVPWTGPIDVRNMIAHEYFRVDFNIIWNIVDRNLPPFKKQIQKLLDDIEYS